MDLIIRQFRDDLICKFNEYKLPIEVKRLVFKEIMIEIENQSNIEIANQLNNSKKEIEEDGNKL